MKRLFSPQIKIEKKYLKFPKNSDWYIKSWPAFMFGLYYQAGQSAVYSLAEKFPWAFQIGINFFKNDIGTWGWNYSDLKRVRKIILAKVDKNPDFFNKIYLKWQETATKQIKTQSWAEKQNIAKLKEKQLKKLFRQVYDDGLDQSSYGYITEAFLSVGEDEWLVQEIKINWPEIATCKDFPEIIRDLYLVTTPSFINEETIALLKLGQQVWQKHHQLKKDTLLKALVTHAKKYFWIENNYYQCPTLSPEYFYRKLRTTIGRKNPGSVLNKMKKDFQLNKQKKQQALKRINADRKLRNLVSMVDKLAHMQDYRKMGVLRTNHIFFSIIKRLAKEKSLPYKDMLYLTPLELWKILQKKKKINIEELRKRRKGCVYVATQRGIEIFTGQDFKKLYGPPFFLKASRVKKIAGTCAYPGKVCGRVKVFLSQKDFTLMKKGMILVANNTTPDYVPAMKKASAIITDQGGLTAHAAIVSRELETPCVIGTKIATRALKDGDRVEVNADKGIVKKL